MVMEITGKVTKGGEAEAFVKIFPSTLEGKPLSSTVGTTTDFDGKFKINIPSELNAKYITARHLEGSSVQKLNPSVNNYDIPLDFVQSQELDEVDIIAKSKATECKEKGGIYNEATKTCTIPKSKPKVSTKAKKVNWTKTILISGIILVVLGTAGYFIIKKVRNK
jgi:hypothetical protein